MGLEFWVWAGLTVAMFVAFIAGESSRQKRSRTFLEGVNEGREEGREEGRRQTLVEVEEMREEKNVGYREAALVIQKKCSVCGKKCLHCAKKAKKVRKKTKTKIRRGARTGVRIGLPKEEEEVERFGNVERRGAHVTVHGGPRISPPGGKGPKPTKPSALFECALEVEDSEWEITSEDSGWEITSEDSG